MSKKILIIGGTGFIGYHLAKSCLKRKMLVTSVSTKLPKKNRFLKKVNYLKFRIENKKDLHKNLKNKEFDFVVNLGGHVDHNNKKKTYASHFIGCKNLSNFFLKKKIKLFLQIGSSSEFGNSVSPHYENSFTKPMKIYGKSKLKASMYLMHLNKKKKFPCVITRLYQVYGPKQDTNRFIPIVIQSCLKNINFPCSNGMQKRDFIYIDDLILCFLKILRNYEYVKGKIFNIGIGKPIKLINIINAIKKKLKGGKPLFGKIKLRVDEPKIIYPDISLIKKTINWKPKTNFYNGLNQTIQYYKNIYS